MREPLIRKEDFKTSIGQGKQAQGRVMGGLPNVWMVCVFGGSREERRRRSV
jgi:hypothetical protein